MQRGHVLVRDPDFDAGEALAHIRRPVVVANGCRFFDGVEFDTTFLFILRQRGSFAGAPRMKTPDTALSGAFGPVRLLWAVKWAAGGFTTARGSF